MCTRRIGCTASMDVILGFESVSVRVHVRVRVRVSVRACVLPWHLTAGIKYIDP